MGFFSEFCDKGPVVGLFFTKDKKMGTAEICGQMCCIAEDAADFIRRELGRVSRADIETKSLNSLVSYVDKTAEEILVRQLGTLLPEAAFLTEEGTVAQGEAPWRWIIDPLDGTTNFLHQLPGFAVSIGLQHGTELVAGVVLEVTRKECFHAWRHGGAYLNGQPIRVSGTELLADALVATGFPYRDFDRLAPYFRAMDTFVRRSRGLRRLGASAVDLAYLACGRFDAFFEYGLSPWDVAAGIVIVREAGGRVSDFRGGTDYLFGEELVAAAPGVFDGVLAVVKEAHTQG